MECEQHLKREEQKHTGKSEFIGATGFHVKLTMIVAAITPLTMCTTICVCLCAALFMRLSIFHSDGSLQLKKKLPNSLKRESLFGVFIHFFSVIYSVHRRRAQQLCILIEAFHVNRSIHWCLNMYVYTTHTRTNKHKHTFIIIRQKIVNRNLNVLHEEKFRRLHFQKLKVIIFKLKWTMHCNCNACGTAWHNKHIGMDSVYTDCMEGTWCRFIDM